VIETPLYKQQCLLLIFVLCPDTSLPLVPKCLDTSSTSADISNGQFDTGAEMSRVRSVSGPKCLYIISTMVTGQLVDMLTHRLEISRTSQLADWTVCGLDNSWMPPAVVVVLITWLCGHKTLHCVMLSLCPRPHAYTKCTDLDV